MTTAASLITDSLAYRKLISAEVYIRRWLMWWPNHLGKMGKIRECQWKCVFAGDTMIRRSQIWHIIIQANSAFHHSNNCEQADNRRKDGGRQTRNQASRRLLLASEAKNVTCNTDTTTNGVSGKEINVHCAMCRSTTSQHGHALQMVRPTQPSIPPGSLNEDQLWLGRQRQV